jgi:hypothetical protein
MKWNLWLLPLMLGGSLSAVYVLPKAGDTTNSAVSMQLPGDRGGWSYKKLTASVTEVETLGKETDFAKAICFKARPDEITDDGYPVPDRVDLSVVLSGYDMNSSIHRPERCLVAQGHSITSSSDVKITAPKGRSFPVKRLRSIQAMRNEKDEVVANFSTITYYFFVGHDKISNDHLERTLVDMKDRLVKGLDQRWAYVSVSMWYGKIPWIKDKEVTEAEADEKLTQFLTAFAEKQIDWNQISWEQIKK